MTEREVIEPIQNSLAPEIYQQEISKYGFKFIKPLGRGVSGHVILVEHKERNEKLAVKIIRKDFLLKNIKLKKKVEREIAIMKLLKHKHLVRFRGVDQDKKFVYLVTEYAPGGELFHVIEEKKLTHKEIFKYFSQVLEALKYLHSMLICHRDLKPENLLLDAEGNIKVSDFGMATLLGPNLMAATSCGSPHYASPEVIECKSMYNGFLADIWSLGVLLYALSTNRLPFISKDKKLRQLLEKVVNCKYDFPKEIDPSLKDLISKMIKKTPKKRMTLEKIFQHPWYVKQEKEIENEAVPVKLGKELEKIKDSPEIPTSTSSYAISDTEIESDLGQSILKIFDTMGFKNRNDLIKSLKHTDKNIESVMYRLLEKRIFEDDDLVLQSNSIFSEEDERQSLEEKNIRKLSSQQIEKSNEELKKAKKENKKTGIFSKLFKKKKEDIVQFEIESYLGEKEAVVKLRKVFNALRITFIYKSETEIDIEWTDLSVTKLDMKFNVRMIKNKDGKLLIIFFPEKGVPEYNANLAFMAIKENYVKEEKS